MTTSPRWKKMIRDMFDDRGRALYMLLPVTIGIFAVTVILSTYSILDREIVSNYMDTNPSSATIDVGEVTDENYATAKNFAGIAEVEARTVMTSRVKVGDDWMPMLLFIVDDFEDVRLNKFRKVSGTWPPATGTMLVEHTAIRVLGQGEGGSVLIKTPHGTPTNVTISGVVHDAALAPAWQEKSGYGYITLDTLAMLGEAPMQEELRIQLDGNPANISLVEETTQALAALLREQGNTIHELKVPPPRTHPHQTQMMTIISLFLVFAGMALLLSAILVATIVAAILTKQVREIGIMKTFGASTSQIAQMYLAMLLILGAASSAIGIPTGIFAGGLFADVMAELLNLTITDYHIPAWIYAILISSGLFVPVLVALPIVMKGTKLSVREAISDSDAGDGNFGDDRLDAILSKLRGIELPYLMAIRNMFRRRGRLLLTLVLLAVGGSMFITGLNVRDGWKDFVGRITEERFYDVEFTLNDATQKDRIENVLASVSGIEKVEYWGHAATAIGHEGKIDVSRTYPDGGHGAFTLFGTPPNTEMIKYPIVSGRWLQKGDVDAVVISHMAMATMPTVKLGDQIMLSIEGQSKPWRLVGVVEVVGSGSIAYVSDSAYDKAADTEGATQMIRIITSAGTVSEREGLIRQIDGALMDAGINVKRTVSLSMLRSAMGEHVSILITTLIATAVLLASIGIFGLISTMTMNVIERTREIGVMRTTGATPGTILKIIVSEGVSIGFISWLLAVLLSLPLSIMIGSMIGNMAFKIPLELTVSGFAVGLWIMLVVVLAALATAIPGRKASRRSVHEALAYE